MNEASIDSGSRTLFMETALHEPEAESCRDPSQSRARLIRGSDEGTPTWRNAYTAKPVAKLLLPASTGASLCGLQGPKDLRVHPPSLSCASKISLIKASRFEVERITGSCDEAHRSASRLCSGCPS